MNPFITLPDFHSCTAFSHNSLFSSLTIAHPHRRLLIVGFPPFAAAVRDQVKIRLKKLIVLYLSLAQIDSLVMLQYYIERQCLLKCTRQIIMHTWKSIMQLDNPVVPIGGIETILVIKVSAESANQFGELVADPVTNELLHYTEKPETFVSDRINCGVYIFTPDFFNAIQGVSIQRKDRGQ
ncbi:uncharacterized protein LOC114289981 isoform X1 [Camellia sinensis]|uniref:uncharacterized protein LOC114289981 isoform X1 n=1 Tax=Camellia sinensis TaxID=4442 RepID=UPI00103602AF|nr:uncharacterized protein LOC114289981 isoform X1 [Camellia sinensis]